MKVSKKKMPGLGRRKNYSPAFFNIETVYFSDESISGDVLYSERARIIKHRRWYQNKNSFVRRSELYRYPVQ